MFDEKARRARRAWILACVVTGLGLAALFVPPPQRLAARTASPPVAAIAPAPPSIAIDTLPAEPAPRTEEERAAVWIEGQGRATGSLLYAPRARSKRPLAVMLHGMGGAPQTSCPPFGAAVSEDTWLVCPRAPGSSSNGGSDWSFLNAESTLEPTLARVAALHAGEVESERERVLMGFSLGALAAVEILRRAEHEWPGVILIAADVQIDAKMLRRAGVKRIVLAAGDRDMMRARMVEVAAKLEREGVAVLFLSMGNVAHEYARDMPALMKRALAFVRGAAES